MKYGDYRSLFTSFSSKRFYYLDTWRYNCFPLFSQMPDSLKQHVGEGQHYSMVKITTETLVPLSIILLRVSNGVLIRILEPTLYFFLVKFQCNNANSSWSQFFLKSYDKWRFSRAELKAAIPSERAVTVEWLVVSMAGAIKVSVSVWTPGRIYNPDLTFLLPARSAAL